MIIWATEIKIRAERRTGELLRDTAKAKQRNTGGKPSPHGNGLHTLNKIGVSRRQSSDWQKLASIPEPEFELRLAEAGRDTKTMTTAKILKPLDLDRPPLA